MRRQVLFAKKFDDILLKIKERTAPWPEPALFPETFGGYRLHAMEAGAFCDQLRKVSENEGCTPPTTPQLTQTA